MRVIVTARSTFAAGYERILQRLVAILGVISKNPSNPNFDQYIFESIAALMRFVVQANPSTLPTFEQALFGPFTIILQQDIDRTYSALILICAPELTQRSLLPRIRPLCVPDPGADARLAHGRGARGVP